MRKLFLLIALFSVLSFAQEVRSVSPYLKVMDFGTVANGVSETGYISFNEFSSIDSISVIAFGTGELDVDSVDMYVGNATSDGSWYSSTALTATVTLDLAAATKGHELLLTSNATRLTGNALRGCNAVKVMIRGAVSGCDATDPNHFYVAFRVWGLK